MSERFLTVYSGVLTVAFGAIFVTGWGPSSKKASFDEIEVHRINVVEPDGTLRMVISDKTRLPGIIIKGQSYPHPNRSTAGVLFFNDEGTENGGLTFGGSKDRDGKVHSHAHLSFDEYMQDQVFSIDASDEDGHRQSGISIVDRGDYSILDLVQLLARNRELPAAEQQAVRQKFRDSHPPDAQRAYLGRSSDNSVGLTLKDPQGRTRAAIRVNVDGSAALQIFDEAGRVISQIPPKS